MLDENLPFFLVKSSNSEHPLNIPVLLREKGSEFQSKYILRKPDPSIPTSKNCYAIALYDSYHPEILYAQVLAEPEWITPTLSTSETRAQTTIPSPIPVIPKCFTIQLHNPDHQVVVRQKVGKWSNSTSWKYEMPQNSFPIPSSSALDRSLNAPALSEVTPKIFFKWKRDGKLSKDIACYLVGKRSDGKKGKEPDITVAYFKSGKGLTIYQPNMHRVEVEDTKGFEIILLLSAVVIKDIFFNPSRELFNITSTKDTASESKLKSEAPELTFQDPNSFTSSMLMTKVLTNPAIDIETERLKKALATEEIRRTEAEAEEERRTKEMLQKEENERRRREAEVEQETKRLRQQYGVKVLTPAISSSSLQENKLPAPKINKFSSKNLPSGLRVSAVDVWLEATGLKVNKQNNTSSSPSSTSNSTSPYSGNTLLTLVQKAQKKKGR